MTKTSPIFAAAARPAIVISKVTMNSPRPDEMPMHVQNGNRFIRNLLLVNCPGWHMQFGLAIIDCGFDSCSAAAHCWHWIRKIFGSGLKLFYVLVNLMACPIAAIQAVHDLVVDLERWLSAVGRANLLRICYR